MTQASANATSSSWAIFWISVVGLFLEMLLIRWVATEVRVFAYLQNTVLVVCFLGLGLGCLTCRKAIDFRPALFALLLLALLLALPPARRLLGGIGEDLSVLHDFVIWYARPSGATSPLLLLARGLGLSLLLLAMLLEVFVPVGRLMGRLIDDHPHTIWAYSVNIAGSLVGIWLFVLLSVWQTPPVIWFAVLAAMLAYFLGTRLHERLVNGGLLAAIVVLAYFAGRDPEALEIRWSPYQKLVLRSASETDYEIAVNNIPYQALKDLSPDRLAEAPASEYPFRIRGLSQYDLPALLHPRPDRVLIVGAGAGNDVAGALRQGVREVVAVEIDPAILDLGRAYHPERPYDSNRVRAIADDARAYFMRSQERFDVIAFGLLDSHTTGAMNNTRLDHFVYTRESMRQARRLLNEGGIVVLSFEAERPYIADRMARVLREEFDQTPMVFRYPPSGLGWGGVMFVAGDLAAVRRQLSVNPRLSALISELRAMRMFPITYTTPVATDNWPYIYLERPTIPTIYYLLAVLLGLLFGWGQLRFGGRDWVAKWGPSNWHFFFLGAGFMLLEVANISRAAVMGSTWWVNAIIISGVLAMILLANALAARFPGLPVKWAYAALMASCVGLFFVEVSWFNRLPFAPRAMLVGGITTLPMLFSGIVFIRSFAAVPHKEQALGANLFGALVGGLLQSLSFAYGIKALLLLVGGLYFCALVTAPRGTTKQPRVPGERKESS